MKVKLLKAKSQPQAAPVVGPSLAEQLRAAQAAAEEYIESVAQKEKAASPLQPLEWHRLDIRLRFGRSAVDCALKLLEVEEKNNGR
jgi:hypothetical protein